MMNFGRPTWRSKTSRSRQPLRMQPRTSSTPNRSRHCNQWLRSTRPAARAARLLAHRARSQVTFLSFPNCFPTTFRLILVHRSGNIRPSQGREPAPFGLPGYTFMQGDDVHFGQTGVMIDGTWTVDCFIQTPFPCTNCATHVASGWHTLVRGQREDHPILLWSQDESTVGAYDKWRTQAIQTHHHN